MEIAQKLADASESLTLAEMFFDINKMLCENYIGLNPLALLDYPAEDVFELIAGTLTYNKRNKKGQNRTSVIRKQAGDNWF